MMTLASRGESNDSWTEDYPESNYSWCEKYKIASNDGLAEQYQPESIDSWAEQYQNHSNKRWSDIYGTKSDDDTQVSDATFDEILEEYYPLIVVKYDSAAMLRMLNDAVIWEEVRRKVHGEIFNDILDGLPLFNKDVMRDMEKWMADSEHEVQAFVKKEYSGMVNADLSWCAYFEDLIDFMEKFIVPRLREQTQRRYASLPDLKEHVMGLWHSKHTTWREEII